MCLDLSSELQGTYCVPEIMLTAYLHIFTFNPTVTHPYY